MLELRCDPATASCTAQSAEVPPSTFPGGDSSPLEQLGSCLREAAEVLQRVHVECARVSGLTDARYRVLQALSEHGGPECTQAELAGRLQQSESHLSSLVEQLAQEGLLFRERSLRDRRKTLVRITDEGRLLAHQVRLTRSQILSRLLRMWTHAQVGSAVAGLRTLVHDLEAWPEFLPGYDAPAPHLVLGSGSPTPFALPTGAR
jgi:DNA-binding MarR family transcriptional regulator